MGTRCLGSTVGLLFALGCTSNPQPLPPPIIDTTLLEIVDGGDGTVTIDGAPGAVDNGETIHIVNPGIASGVGSEVDGVIASNGSFSVLLEGVLADEFRLLAANSTAVADPVDVVIEPDSGEVVEAPESTCLQISPGHYIDLGTVSAQEIHEHDITLQNSSNCPDIAIEVGQALDKDAWSHTFMAPQDLAPGESLVFEIRFELPENVAVSHIDEVFIISYDHDVVSEQQLISARASTFAQ